MPSNTKTAISEAFSSQLGSLRSLIDDLLKSHTEERAFISATLTRYAVDAGDIARQLPQEIVQNQSHDLPVGDTASTPTEASCNWDWMLDLPDSPPLLELPSEKPLDFNSGNFVDREHETEFWELDMSVTVPHNCENGFHATENDSLSSITPAMVDLATIEEIRQPDYETSTPKPGKYAASQEKALTCLARGGKTSKRTRDTLPHESTDMVDMPHLKKRRVAPSACDNELQKSRTKKLSKKIDGSTKNLNDIYLATAGSEALCQLKGMIDALRGISGSKLAMAPTTIGQTLRMLDALENSQHATVFLRRTCFLKLGQLRKTFADRFTNERERRPDDGQSTVLIVGKLESNILDHLMKEAYPEITQRPHTASGVRKWRDEHERERKSLKNRLQIAKKWHQLSQRFPCGILAVIPSGGQFEISNHKLETLSDNEFEKLLDLLDGRPDNYVRRAAELFTPYVEAILNGQEYSQDSWPKMDLSALINQCEEVFQPSGSIFKEARITTSLDDDMSLAISC